MTDPQTLIAHTYAAFNNRNIDAALALMTDDVSWPKASEGGRVLGKDEIRSYWTRQWREFDPHVDPVEIIDHGSGKVEVRVHQVVKTVGGDLLSDSEVGHLFTIRNGLIQRMDLEDTEAGSRSGASAAFSHH